MCAIILFVQKTIMRMALMDFLLPFLYVIFISLGLPDSLFGVAWPVMHEEMNVSESFGSVYQMVVGFCTAGISLIAGKLLRRYGTARVTYVSTILTVIGLIGMSYAKSLIFLIFFAVVLGYGAGAIDTGLNSYVSTLAPLFLGHRRGTFSSHNVLLAHGRSRYVLERRLQDSRNTSGMHPHCRHFHYEKMDKKGRDRRPL